MTFYVLSIMAILATVVGCALIWGFDMSRAREIERGFPPPTPEPALEGAEGSRQLEAHDSD